MDTPILILLLPQPRRQESELRNGALMCDIGAGAAGLHSCVLNGV